MKMCKVPSRSGQFLAHNLTLLKFLLLLLALAVSLSLVIHHYLANLSTAGDFQPDPHRTRLIDGLPGDPDSELPHARPASGSRQQEIEELRRIKASVSNELRQLENRRLHLQADITDYAGKIDALKAEHGVLNKEVSQIRVSLEHIRFEQEERRLHAPNIRAPHRILRTVDPQEPLDMPGSAHHCRMESCFDFSRCSLVSGFPVFLYDPHRYALPGHPVTPGVASAVLSYLSRSSYRTEDAASACLFVLVLGETSAGSAPPSAGDVEDMLLGLPHWAGDGRNHLLLTLASSLATADLLTGVATGRAMVAQPFFTDTAYRPGFDLVIPPNFGPSVREGMWRHLPQISPVRRKLLLSYLGEYSPLHSQHPPSDHRLQPHDFPDNSPRGGKVAGRRPLSAIDSSLLSSQTYFSHIEQAIVASLKSFQVSYQGSVDVDLSCGQFGRALTTPADWSLCDSASARRDRTIGSTFSLILLPLNASLESTLAFQTRLYEALNYGAIPVILGSHGLLPFAEVLRWESAAVVLPTPRVTEIPFFLQSFPDEAVSSLRLQGRHFFLNYLSSTESVLDTVLATLRSRLQIPPVTAREEPAPTAFPPGFVPLKYEGPEPEPESDEVLGPAETPFPSEAFRHNYSTSSVLDPFNSLGDPFTLYPYTPFEPVLPSEAKFKGSSFGFRPINRGAGGDGKDFSIALGGNTAREQFTVVMLTYDREVVLLQALQRFKGLPFLNKVLVVWNGEGPPSEDLRWPDIGVPIKVVKTRKNSLNNRFLPYEAIETEAVLSIDDDAHLRHDEIVFGFRVWREERTRVVGFPGRFHAWDVRHQSWNYNSNYSCELSMVLTGAAFFHKYYAYQYSYVMPQAIRDKVDEYMNCEDIAMNFLVAHITRKPPVKVTSRWTFRCPGCPSTLSSNSSHFEERHRCINFFSQVYGYMPLLYTQYRVDSVLFKTRISHDKTKCFKYI
ncbi:exostosin-like 3 [Aplysia californica]|uniref:Exostosin-like 3 n=1 Tax=Aplysia californica TaxID=6500 RepID=A0ABM1ABW1_APLCA|nr:exostosin-like 3 [Aplysia californica]